MEEKFSVTGNIDNKAKIDRFISVDETIARAKKRGVDFGNGNDRNRLRYYAKKNLIPPAQRKVFNGGLPTGAYPEYVVDLLVEIDQELKKGKTIRSIAEENKHKNEIDLPVDVFEEISEPEEEIEFRPPVLTRPRMSKVFIFFFIVLIGSSIFVLSSRGQEMVSDFFASMYSRVLLVQTPAEEEPIYEDTVLTETFVPESYLTINVETDINAPLNLKGSGISFFRDDLEAQLSVPNLTADRTYDLPDSSGTICLSNGNCVGIGGEVITSGGTANRLTKFLGANRIANSSILDSYAGGVALVISNLGNVGIGTAEPGADLEVSGSMIVSQQEDGPAFRVEVGDDPALYIDEDGNVAVSGDDPEYALDVGGRIQASGDICTDLKGGKCLSEISGKTIILGGGGGGMSGSGSANYLSKFSDSDSLTHSIVYESSSNIGIGTTAPNEKLTVSGVLSLAEASAPSVTADFGKLYVATDNKLYYKDESGAVYDLTAPGVSGSGLKGQLAVFTASTTIHGNNNLFWNSTTSRLGIGTSTPDYALDVFGGLRVSATTSFNGLTYVWPTSYASSGYVLSNSSGTLSWVTNGPSGTGASSSVAFWLNPNTLSYTNDFYWDNSAKRLGIGTSSPDSVLHVIGTSTLGVIRSATWQGNVIGTSYGGTNWDSSTSTGFAFLNSGAWSATTTLSDTYVADALTIINGTINNTSIGITTSTIAKFTTATTSNLFISSLSPGSLIFAGANGLITSDSSNLFWDNSTNRLGLGTSTPDYTLDIVGSLRASGTTTFNGLSYNWPSSHGSSGYVLTNNNGSLSWTASGGVTGTGSTGTIAFWSNASALTNDNNLYWDSSTHRLGIGTTSPSQALEVSGTAKVSNLITSAFQLPTGATSGYALISDASGVGTWQSLPAGSLPVASSGQTLRHNGSDWIATSFLYNNGSAIGIGTTSPSSTLTVAGDMSLAGAFSLTSTSLPQFLLSYDAGNYLDFSVNATETQITASKNLIIDSLTGEIRTGSNVTLLNATGAEVRGSTFTSSDATVRASGEYILRASVPVFAYSMPVQSTANSYTRVSKQFATSSSLASSTPTVLSGTSRKYAFLINYADNTDSGDTVDWRVFRPNASTVSATFTFPGQSLSSLQEGYPIISDFYTLPDNDWQLEVKVPVADTIRIFSIFLLAYDQLN